MKNKNLWLLTIFSIIACGIHTIILNSEYTQYTFTSAFKVILFITLPLIYFAVTKNGKFRDIFSRGDKKYIKLCFIIGGIVFALIITAFMGLRRFIDNATVAETYGGNGINGNNFPLVFIYIVLINAALEEIFFRGFVFMTLYRLNSKRYAYIYSSLLFAIYHIAILNGALSPAIFIFCMFGLVAAGLIFNFLTLGCKSIVGSLIVHISANLAINIIVAALYLK